jgi:polyisoprenoid-binding protein YceI
VVTGAFVKVPVRALKCGDRHMEAHMYDALKASSEGFITARLEALPCSQADIRTVDVAGRLTIAGVERSITISVEGERLANGILHARGSLPILMTDYGVTPPRPWGGILRTANKVVIQFEIYVDPRAASVETLALQ